MPPQSDILNYIVFDLQGTAEKQPFWLMLFPCLNIKKKSRQITSVVVTKGLKTTPNIKIQQQFTL